MTSESSLISSPFGLIRITTRDKKFAGIVIDFVNSNPSFKMSLAHYSTFHEKVRNIIIDYLQGISDIASMRFYPGLTPFQQKVLEAVRNIPYGQTASYATIAKSIGHPKAVRAVASAIAKNQILILIPCHRVIRSDGSVGKYRAGPKIKQSLLDFEKSNPNPHKPRHRP